MRSEAYRKVHVIYAALMRGRIVYVGCTQDFEQRKYMLFVQKEKFKENRGKVKFKILFKKRGRRAAHKLETETIANLKSARLCKWNTYPSYTLSHDPIMKIKWGRIPSFQKFN